MNSKALALLALIGAGCSGSISRDQLYPEMYKALCSRYARCGQAHSESSCTALYLSYLDQSGLLLNAFDASIAAGKVKYNGDRARRCVDSIGGGACSSALSGATATEDCRFTFEGQMAVGEACMSGECVPSAYCTRDTGATACPGTCVARVPEGGTASKAAECVVPLVLIGGKCAKPRATGESCTTSAECADLACGTDSKCKAPGANGDACSATAPCGFGTCVDSVCRSLGDTGEACVGSASSYQSAGCKLDLYCDRTASAAGTCQEPKSEGQSCSGLTSCAPPLQCSSAMVCAKPATAGQSCSAILCEGSSYCDSDTKLCKVRVPEGQACKDMKECVTGAYCTDGKCKSYMVSTCP